MRKRYGSKSSGRRKLSRAAVVWIFLALLVAISAAYALVILSANARE